jgi:hypothetical protein
MNEEIEVTVTFTERVTYSGTVRMTKEKFAKYEAALDSDDRQESRRATEAVAELLDRSNDWQDSDDIEIEVFGN